MYRLLFAQLIVGRAGPWGGIRGWGGGKAAWTEKSLAGVKVDVCSDNAG